MHGVTPQDLDYGSFADGRSPLAEAEPVKVSPKGPSDSQTCSPPPSCAILSLALTSSHADDTVKRSTSYNEPHTERDPGATRFRVIPMNAVKIEWTLENSAQIDCAVIEMFATGKRDPIWTVDLDSITGDTGSLTWDTKVTAGAPDFPDHFVNLEHSPYKLKMTIRPKETAVCTRPFALTYFDVDFEHKYKAIRYIPTTDLGRVGLEFDEKEPEIKLAAKTFFVMLVPERASFSQSLDHYKQEFCARCSAMWNQRYALKDANDNLWKVSLLIEDAGSASVDAALDARTIDACPPDVIAAFEASGADFCVVLLAGNGQSGLPTPDYSRTANIFLFEVAFDAVHSAGMKRRVLEGHRKLIDTDVDAIWVDPAYTNHTAEKERRLPEMNHVFTVKFPKNSDTLSQETEDLLAAISDALRSRCEGLDFRVFVKGARTAGETATPNLEQLRATKVNELLAPAPHPCRRTAGEMATEPPEFILDAEDDAEIEGAQVEIRSLGGDIPYSAATHEFGHLLGLPDEYAQYGPMFCPKVAPSQTEYQRLTTVENFDYCPVPYIENNALMSAGTEFWERYYLTVLQTQRKLLGVLEEREDMQWTIVPTPTPAAAPTVAMSADFTPVVKALQAGERLTDQGEDDLATLETTMKTTAEGEGAPRVVYSKILQRNGLGRRSAASPDWTVGDQLLYTIGVQNGRKLLHGMTYVKPRLVEPVIDIPGSSAETATDTTVNLRQMDATRRELIILRSTQAFQGTGTFTCASPNIDFYDTEGGDTPIAGVDTGLTLTAAELEQGRKVYADNDLDGARLDLVLNPTGGQVSTATTTRNLKYPDQANPWLQVYTFSVDPAEVTEPLKAIERTNGAFVPLNDTDNPEHMRQRVLVKVCLPMGWNTSTKMVLRVKDDFLAVYKRRGDKGSDLKGSKKTRNGVTWREYELDPKGQKKDHFLDKRTMTVWLEGKVLADEADVELVSTKFKNNAPLATYDTFKARVGACHSATLEVPATDPLTARTVPATGPANAAAPQIFDAADVAGIVGGDSPFKSRDFTKNPPMVVVKGSLGANKKLLLKARYSVGLKTQFFLEQAADDHATLKAANTQKDDMPLPKSNQTTPYIIGSMQPTDVDVEIPTENVGSFHILVKAAGCTCHIINLVVVEAVAQAGPETPYVANLPNLRDDVHNKKFVNGLALEVRTGNIPFPNPQTESIASLQNQCCAVLAGRVHVRGGGPDFQRGVVGRVFSGWIQNKTHGQIEGSYRDGSGHAVVDYTMRAKFVRNQSDGFLLAATGDRLFGNDQPALDEIAYGPASPFLDTGRDPVGGSQSCLGQRKFEWDPNVICDCVSVAVDSPGTEFLVSHFSKGNALLRRAVYQHTFKSYLCVWTDATGRDQGGLNPGPGDHLYAVVADVEWGFDAAWDITWPGNIATLTKDGRRGVADWQSQATVTPDVAKPLNAQITTPYNVYPQAVAAEGLVETRSPTPIRTLAWDAKAP